MTYSITRFGLYDMMKSGWKQMKGNEGSLAVWELAACAGLAGGFAGLVGNPAEVRLDGHPHHRALITLQIVLVRMCTDAVKPQPQRYSYRNCFHGIYRVVRDEGFGVLYRGTGPNILRSVSMSNWQDSNNPTDLADSPTVDVSQLAAYDAIKAQLISSGGFADDISTHLTTGVLAGTLATTVAAPFDVVKSRIQTAQASGTGVGTVLREGLRKEGPRFMFRGWTPAWLRLT
jgi:dicarboxylate transporter 10